MPSKSLGETLLRGAARITEPLAQHDLARRVARGDEDASRVHERRGKSDVKRPDGIILWFHTEGLKGALNIVGVIQQCLDEMSEITVLVTTQEQIQDFVFALRMPAGVLHQYAPFDKPAAVERFLDHWAPNMCIWTDDALMPVMNREVSDRKIPAILANVEDIEKSNPQFRWLPSIGKPILRSFDQILVVDATALKQVYHFGAEATMMGPLCEEALALSHDEVRRSRLSKQLDGRPVWLAARVSEGEIDMVLEAHKKALRQTHRLMLIVVPADPNETGRVCDACATHDLHFKNSNDLDDLPPRTDVIVAKGFDGLGIWYQMAAVCFLGGSLVNGGGHTPLEAANLGSAIIHGPHVDNYADIYLRLRDAGAAIEVGSVSSLVEAVTELVIPDRAAAMAHAGWVVSSEGADATDALVEAIWDHFPMGTAT
jgi:3-deoxy-D-manno-octulosonic-acid transferase